MAPKKLSEREALHRDVEFERLSPADADARLIELGQKPFQYRRPDLSRLDPMLENEWTLPMAAAWFIWRSAVAVRD